MHTNFFLVLLHSPLATENFQLSNMNMHNQNNHSFINNGKASSTAVQQMNNMGSMNGMNYNNSARQYHGNHHQQVSISTPERLRNLNYVSFNL